MALKISAESSLKNVIRPFCLFLFGLLVLTGSVNAQQTVNALFLGNSYTTQNNMPDIVSDFAKSRGNTLVKTVHAPGGYQLVSHAGDEATRNLIKAKKWNYVILQEQSQKPSFPDGQVATGVYPYAKSLSEMVRANDSCTEVAFYMTWGRKNGDQGNCPSWPPVCTYEGMDSLLALRYHQMAQDNDGIVSPVGAVWRYLRKSNSTINLYAPDESHPSEAGSYAAACCFYTTLFRDDPTLSDYQYTLSDSVAAQIKRVVKRVVYNHLDAWYVGNNDPTAEFTFIRSGIDSGTVTITNTSKNAASYQWLVDGKEVSTDVSPVLTFDSIGVYRLTLVAYGCLRADSSETLIDVGVSTSLPSYEWLDVRVKGNSLVVNLRSDDYGRVQVLDLSGRVLLDQQFSATLNTAIPKSLDKSFVIIQVESKGRVYRQGVWRVWHNR